MIRCSVHAQFKLMKLSDPIRGTIHSQCAKKNPATINEDNYSFEDIRELRYSNFPWIEEVRPVPP